MNCPSKFALVAGLASVLALSPLAAQSPTAEDPADKFDSENAILDTSLLFAIGAQEARQSLRGSFGWPTFQEGLVEGVYFRFDPDGYARFSPAPRLDTDVFEVICRPRTYSCMGRKGALAMFLNARGQLQLKIDGVAEGDTFHIAEGVTEIELPPRILQPLDNRFEALLMAGGELVVRRGGKEFERISLVGFSAVATYLRWVMARQDYTVLPRGWPVPNSRASQPGGITQAASWQSPMPQPQAVPVGPALSVEPIAAMAASEPSRQEDLAEVKSEIAMLRALLEESRAGAAAQRQTVASGASPEIGDTLHVPLGEVGALEERIARLESAMSSFEQMLAGRGASALPPSSEAADPLVAPTDIGAAGAAAAFGADLEESSAPATAGPRTSEVEAFFNRSLGLEPSERRVAPEAGGMGSLKQTLEMDYDVPPDVADMIMELIAGKAAPAQMADEPALPPAAGQMAGDPFAPADQEMIDLFRTREVDRILAELDDTLPPEETPLSEESILLTQPVTSQSGALRVVSADAEVREGEGGRALPTEDLQEYLTLSAYFKSVLN
ncbi:hypothetical protein PSA7680_03265 [Pseudoruegeria aquimaris]|uniref:Uncharacterized protein n=1 Tax=Pseudoruegeria aquimaris TaxID=393663 RepID=A0A1Y5TJJ8_9RHOB|nr:hypothetical protein [Pseudoruegeria aquimaris]SLN61894.1 hypothetical protein PSA7680_03265 [Pseudoruegeria aquimaris]